MAKVDDNRDYYAELSLAPGADISEINKQYRKLGESFTFPCPSPASPFNLR